MAGQILMLPAYMIPRTALWIVLLALAVLDGLRHIHENARARKLYFAVVVVITAMVAQDVLLTLYAIGGGNHFGAGILFQVYILVTDAADSLWTALLLTIAAGFCITRQDLGPYKLKVTVIPTVYFVTIIIVDFIMYSVRGRTAFNVADFDKGDPIEFRLSSWERLLLVVCAFVNLMALMAAWVYIFDTIQKEREALEMPERDVYAEAEAGQRPGQVPAQQPESSGEGAGHAVQPTLEDDVPQTYGGVTGEDLDGPKTVEEKVSRLAKVRLLKQFSFGVIAYVLATALVVLLPIFVSPEASAGEAAVRVVLILQNLVLLLFMGGLAWIFRMRGDSPYLMVDEEEGGAAEGGDAHLRTELGVLGEEEANGRGSPHSDDMDAFNLHDIEDDEPEVQQRGSAQLPTSTAAAPVVDPKAEAPKAELLKGVPRSDAPS